ncbi:MAG: hypothetical protein Q7R90_03380 [bacterium]|nr:hypothetical protein [bacterium]
MAQKPKRRWEDIVVDEETADPEKRRLIKAIVKKQGFYVPERGPGMAGIVLQPLDALAYVNLIKEMAPLSKRNLERALKMERTPG